ncbi:MAG: DUF488 domain-containing protein [Nitrososphaerota archaeon]|nr:DUF488 domain-containing protein [Nitrososphaerota archaeon]
MAESRVLRTMGKVYSVGYGRWKDARRFAKYLRELKVNILIDVRRFPVSKNPDFNKDKLKEILENYGIKYYSFSDLLGGYRKEGYRKFLMSDQYREGVNKIADLIKGKTAAIMCLEHKTKYCHRRYIMQSLSDLGIEVILLE